MGAGARQQALRVFLRIVEFGLRIVKSRRGKSWKAIIHHLLKFLKTKSCLRQLIRALRNKFGTMSLLPNKFRGCLIGALLGDCFGAPYEGELQSAISKKQLQAYFDKLEGPPFKTPLYKYTDDTAMTKSVAESLLQHNGFNAYDMAAKFVIEYLSEPKRGYGENVTEVFRKLNNQNLAEVWRPAREQFNGTGSYGNGAAMRVAPIALFYPNFEQMLDVTSKASAITHTNPLGVNGALLQAIAIHFSLNADPAGTYSRSEFTERLIDAITEIEKNVKRVVPPKMSFKRQLSKINELLEKDASPEQVVEELGNDVAAPYSVPTAIYCFLRAQEPIPDIETDNAFRRTIQYAVSLGGDTDTIASMAGAIAGAFYGIDAIDENLQNMAENREFMDKLATKIYERIHGKPKP